MENKKKILIVEDDVAIVSALSIKLSENDFSILTARNGEEGLAVALRDQPDLILLDIVMPKMDGINMLEKLREDEWGKKVEVIILTNQSGNEEIAKVLDNNATEYLIKTNIKIEEVVKKIKAKLGVQ
ncbi:MAG: response regulator [Candidatus Vogelbacteria bacterium]|nr:response regulator [Candidatus Vogelbacteria bacterium]